MSMYSGKCCGRNKKWTNVMLTLQNLFPKAFTGKETKRRLHFQKLQATMGAKKAKFEPTLPASSLPPKATKYCFGGAGGHVFVTCIFKSHSNCYCWMDLLKRCQLYCNYISVPKMATAKVRSKGCSKRGPTFAP